MSPKRIPEDADGTGEGGESAPSRAFARHEVGQALSQSGFGDVLVLSHEAADQALTPTRREIVATLAETEVESLRELADELDRDPGNLSRDMRVLVAEDIVRYDTTGKSKRPELKHDTIVVEPLIASDDPLPETDSSA